MKNKFGERIVEMKTILAIALVLASGAGLRADDTIPPSMLPKSAENEIALRAYMAATGDNLLAEVSVKHTGDFTLGVDVPGIGKKGEKIQQMELKHLDGQVHGLVLVNVSTRGAYVVFPKKLETQAPNLASEPSVAPAPTVAFGCVVQADAEVLYEIHLDGKLVSSGRTLAPGKGMQVLELAATQGDHVLLVTAPGCEPWQRTIVLASGAKSHASFRVELKTAAK